MFIQPFDHSAPARQVSADGGMNPAWAPDGKHIYYLDQERALWEVPYLGAGSTEAPHRLLPPGFTEPSDWWTRGYCVAPDGRFLVIRDVPGGTPSVQKINVIVNWTEELKRLVPPS